MSCDANFNNCVDREMENMRYPMDARSLYAKRIYDQQTANSRCYAENPINIVEGFGMSRFSLVTLLKWTIIVLILIAIYLCVKDYVKEEVSLNVSAPLTEVNSAVPMTVTASKI